MFASVVSQTIQADVVALGLLAGTIIPLLVAVLAKASAPSSVKAALNAVLTCAGVVVAFLIANDGKATVAEIVSTAGACFLTAGSLHAHFWKPLGVTGAIQNATRKVGIG